MADAILLRGLESIRKTVTAAVASGEIHQLADGRAGVYTGFNAAASGDAINWVINGQFTITKTSGVVLLDGGPVYWDHSANAATYRKVSDRDFMLGVAVGDASSSATTVVVDLNVKPRYTVNVSADPCLSVVVGTPAAGYLARALQIGGCHKLSLDSANAAEKTDLLSVDGFAPGAKWIVEGAFRITGGGSTSAPDFNIGVASATHASDADSIAESAFIHIDGNSVNINAECDDGTNEVASTDTTIDYTAGSALSTRVEFVIDGRSTSSLAYYVNGSRVLSGTTFNISAAAGPLFLLAHAEKSTGTDTFEVDIDWLRVRTAEQ